MVQSEMPNFMTATDIDWFSNKSDRSLQFLLPIADFAVSNQNSNAELVKY